jgi:hypothetical protein
VVPITWKREFYLVDLAMKGPARIVEGGKQRRFRQHCA